MTNDKPKGEVSTILNRPADPDILNKAAWYSEYMQSTPQEKARGDAISFPSLVFEYLKLALWKYDEVFIHLKKDRDSVSGTILPPGTITAVIDRDNDELVGYYEGMLPDDGDMTGVKTYQPEEILHLRKGT